MKTKLKLLLALSLTALSATAQAFLSPTNPPPQVQLFWDRSPTANVTNYFIYYGIGSRQYTNKLAFGNVTNASITLPARGVTFFFTCTAQGSGQESDFSNELSWMPSAPPAPPNLRPLVILTVQKSASGQGAFADTSMTYSDDPSGEAAFYRLKVDRGFALTITSPPMPHK